MARRRSKKYRPKLGSIDEVLESSVLVADLPYRLKRKLPESESSEEEEQTKRVKSNVYKTPITIETTTSPPPALPQADPLNSSYVPFTFECPFVTPIENRTSLSDKKFAAVCRAKIMAFTERVHELREMGVQGTYHNLISRLRGMKITESDTTVRRHDAVDTLRRSLLQARIAVSYPPGLADSDSEQEDPMEIDDDSTNAFQTVEESKSLHRAMKTYFKRLSAKKAVVTEDVQTWKALDKTIKEQLKELRLLAEKHNGNTQALTTAIKEQIGKWVAQEEAVKKKHHEKEKALAKQMAKRRKQFFMMPKTIWPEDWSKLQGLSP